MISADFYSFLGALVSVAFLLTLQARESAASGKCSPKDVNIFNEKKHEIQDSFRTIVNLGIAGTSLVKNGLKEFEYVNAVCEQVHELNRAVKNITCSQNLFNIDKLYAMCILGSLFEKDFPRNIEQLVSTKSFYEKNKNQMNKAYGQIEEIQNTFASNRMAGKAELMSCRALKKIPELIYSFDQRRLRGFLNFNLIRSSEIHSCFGNQSVSRPQLQIELDKLRSQSIPIIKKIRESA